MMQTPDGNGRLELVKFHSPSNQGDNRHAPANTPGIRHIAFAVEGIDAVVAGLRARGAELVGELERYEDSYRLCYVRGPEGIIIELEGLYLLHIDGGNKASAAGETGEGAIGALLKEPNGTAIPGAELSERIVPVEGQQRLSTERCCAGSNSLASATSITWPSLVILGTS
jgi:hypothetical protein